MGSEGSRDTEGWKSSCAIAGIKLNFKVKLENITCNVSQYYCLYFMFDQINVFQNIKKYTHPKPLNNVFQAQQPMTAMKYSMRSFYYILYYY